MTTFYIVRHGQKESIPVDPALTYIGLKQAENTAEILKEIEFVDIISSPKLRTRQTAQKIASFHPLDVKIDNRLLERLEWKNDETFEEFMYRWNQTDIDRNLKPENGLASSINGQQIKDFLGEVASRADDGNVLLVTHGGTIGDLLRNLFTEDAIEHKINMDSGAKYIDVLECSLTVIQKEGDKYTLTKLIDVSHLQDA